MVFFLVTTMSPAPKLGLLGRQQFALASCRLLPGGSSNTSAPPLISFHRETLGAEEHFYEVTNSYSDRIAP